MIKHNQKKHGETCQKCGGGIFTVNGRKRSVYQDTMLQEALPHQLPQPVEAMYGETWEIKKR